MLRILSNVDPTQASMASDMTGAAGIPADPQRLGAPHHLSEVPEVPHLPIISAGGFDAHVLCAIGDTVEDTTYVTYLSLLGPGTAVAAIWASLMDQRQIVVTLEEVGNIQLWQRQPAVATLGYAITWRRRTRVLQLAHGARLVHLVTEPDLLTMRDPESADAADRRRKRERGEGRERSTAPIAPSSRSATHRMRGEDTGQHGQDNAVAMEQVSEQVARETRPLFVLLGQRNDDTISLARRHLLFLAQRIQWLAYYELWADFFWQRGLDTGEVRPLTVWPLEEVPDDARDESARHDERWITTAYLCQPDPLALATALPEAVQHQHFSQQLLASNAIENLADVSVSANDPRREHVTDEGAVA